MSFTSLILPSTGPVLHGSVTRRALRRYRALAHARTIRWHCHAFSSIFTRVVASKNNRRGRIEALLLPGGNLLQYGTGDGRDQPGRHVNNHTARANSQRSNAC